jgi:hypothetical protein
MLEDLYAMPFFLRRHRTGLFGPYADDLAESLVARTIPRTRFVAYFAGCAPSASGSPHVATHSTTSMTASWRDSQRRFGAQNGRGGADGTSTLSRRGRM